MILANKKYRAIGLMSGTSLDGVDIAACEFWQENTQWSYKIIEAHTYKFSPEIFTGLENAPQLSALELAYLNVKFGRFLGKLVHSFIAKYKFTPDFIASHGYTVFHEPEKALTLQIGSGAEIAARSGIKTICDFRTSDVAHGGQGAPLVPIGDALLFGTYDACLNLGGFANISYTKEDRRLAFDICPVNFLLNPLAQKLGSAFDNKGELGRQGEIDSALLYNLNALDFYTASGPKSLGREYVESSILPLFSSATSNYNLLRTCYEHISTQLATTINAMTAKQVLITGGGAYNSFLLELLQAKTKAKLVIPDPELIDFKEALIFAFLGLLRLHEKPNCLASATGASIDTIGGSVYL
jgi:anhydro-N-acetylmuramic acid kinase